MVARILAYYPHASPLQRWHLRSRVHLCPYDALLKHLNGPDHLLDVRCGCGHLAWYLAEMGSPLRYYGSDIDKRKIDLALGCPMSPDIGTSPLLSQVGVPPGRSRPSFRFGDVREWPDLPTR